MSEPLLTQNSCFSSFKGLNSQEADSYKQYDTTTGNLLNCYYPQTTPMAVAISQTNTTALSETDYQNQAAGQCDLSKTPSGSHKEIWDFFDKEYQIYKKLYANNVTGDITSINQLVPVPGDDNITCPDGFVPYIMEYNLDLDFSRFARFCATDEQISKLSFTSIGDYNIYSYLNSSNKLPCKTSSCQTLYAPFLCHNLNPEPLISDNRERDTNINTYIIVGSVIFVIFLAIIIFLLVNLYKKKKLKN